MLVLAGFDVDKADAVAFAQMDHFEEAEMERP